MIPQICCEPCLKCSEKINGTISSMNRTLSQELKPLNTGPNAQDTENCYTENVLHGYPLPHYRPFYEIHRGFVCSTLK